MNEATVIALSIVIFGWAILSRWLAARNLTGALVFLVAGLPVATLLLPVAAAVGWVEAERRRHAGP